MQNQRDLMERLSVFSDQLSEEAKSAFEADLCGVLAYAGAPMSIQTAKAFDYDPTAGRERFADAFYHAWRRSLDGLLLPAEQEAEDLIPIGSRKLAAFIGWIVQNCGEEIEAEVLRDPSPVVAMDVSIVQVTRDVVSKYIDVEPHSKAEMRLAASLPADLSLQIVRNCLDVAPDAPVLKLSLSIMKRELPDRPTKSDRVYAIRRAVQQASAPGLKTVSRNWLFQLLAQRSMFEGDVVLATLDSTENIASQPPEEAISTLLVDAALASFDAHVERVRRHVRIAGDRALSKHGLIELTGTTRLGHTLWSNIEFENHEAWSKRFGAARRQLKELLAPRLELGQPVFERLLVSSSSRLNEPMRNAMQEAPLFMAELALIRSRPDVFAANTVVRSVASKVVGMFEMGLPRLFDGLSNAKDEERSYLAARLQAALMAADPLFAGDYTKMMRQRLARMMQP